MLEILPIGRCLYGKRIFLRRFSKRDAKELFSNYKVNKIWLTPWVTGIPKTLSLRDIEWDIRKGHRDFYKGIRIDSGIFLSSSKACIGRISLYEIRWGINLSAEIGYWLSKPHGNQEFMKEALATLVSFSFEELGLNRLICTAQRDNHFSVKLLQKLGFQQEGTLRQHLFINGKWKDHLLFTCLRDEYDRNAENWEKFSWLGY